MRPRAPPTPALAKVCSPPSFPVVWFGFRRMLVMVTSAFKCVYLEVMAAQGCRSKPMHVFENADDVMQECMIKHLT